MEFYKEASFYITWRQIEKRLDKRTRTYGETFDKE